MAGTDKQRRDNFAMIPNIIDDMALSAPAVRPYLHIKKVTGDDGVCYQRQRQIAAHRRMAYNTVARAKIELIQAGLIKVIIYLAYHATL